MKTTKRIGLLVAAAVAALSIAATAPASAKTCVSYKSATVCAPSTPITR